MTPIRPKSEAPLKKRDGHGVTKPALITGLAVLLLCMFVPLIFSLAMKFDLQVTRDVTPQEMARNFAFPGAMKEKLDTVTSTDYSATFVPSRLTDSPFQFSLMQVLYGPVLLTGVTIDMVPDLKSREQGFTGHARLAFASGFPSVLFYVFLLLILILANLMYRGATMQFLKFTTWIVALWLLYTLVLSLFSGPLTSPANDAINQVLGRENNPLNFSPRYWDVLGAPVRVFLVCMAYWLVTSLSRRPKAIPTISSDGRKPSLP